MPAPAGEQVWLSPSTGIGSCGLTPRGYACCLWHQTHPGGNGRWPPARISGWDGAPWPVPPWQLPAVPRGSAFAIPSSGSGSRTSGRPWQRRGSPPPLPARFLPLRLPGREAAPAKCPSAKRLRVPQGHPAAFWISAQRTWQELRQKSGIAERGEPGDLGDINGMNPASGLGTVAASGYFLEVFGYF